MCISCFRYQLLTCILQDVRLRKTAKVLFAASGAAVHVAARPARCVYFDQHVTSEAGTPAVLQCTAALLDASHSVLIAIFCGTLEEHTACAALCSVADALVLLYGPTCFLPPTPPTLAVSAAAMSAQKQGAVGGHPMWCEFVRTSPGWSVTQCQISTLLRAIAGGGVSGGLRWAPWLAPPVSARTSLGSESVPDPHAAWYSKAADLVQQVVLLSRAQLQAAGVQLRPAAACVTLLHPLPAIDEEVTIADSVAEILHVWHTDDGSASGGILADDSVAVLLAATAVDCRARQGELTTGTAVEREADSTAHVRELHLWKDAHSDHSSLSAPASTLLRTLNGRPLFGHKSDGRSDMAASMHTHTDMDDATLVGRVAGTSRLIPPSAVLASTGSLNLPLPAGLAPVPVPLPALVLSAFFRASLPEYGRSSTSTIVQGEVETITATLVCSLLLVRSHAEGSEETSRSDRGSKDTGSGTGLDMPMHATGAPPQPAVLLEGRHITAQEQTMRHHMRLIASLPGAHAAFLAASTRQVHP